MPEEKEQQVLVEIELPNEIILALALQAHEKDITLNEHIVNILKKHIEDEERKDEIGGKDTE